MLGLPGDTQLSNPPKDTVTRLVFDAPRQRLLASSWDGSAYLYTGPRPGSAWWTSGQAYRSKEVQDEALLDASFHQVSAASRGQKLRRCAASPNPCMTVSWYSSVTASTRRAAQAPFGSLTSTGQTPPSCLGL
jgi:hypothetical protein